MNDWMTHWDLGMMEREHSPALVERNEVNWFGKRGPRNNSLGSNVYRYWRKGRSSLKQPGSITIFKWVSNPAPI